MTQQQAARLSKSRIQYGLQCRRRLWLQTYRRDLIEIDASQQAGFEVGNVLGELARTLFGPGSLIGHDHDLDLAVTETTVLLESKVKAPVLFEATFRYGGVLVRADVLRRIGRGHEVIEVKGSASVKAQYIDDCAAQAWVIENAGLPLKRIHVAYVDSQFVYRGNGDYRGLLISEDVTRSVRERMAQVPRWVRAFRRVLAGTEPDIQTGAHCDDPYPCPFFAHCRAQEPPDPEYPVQILPHSSKKLAGALRQEGFLDVRDVPVEMLKSEIHQRIRAASISGKPFLDKAARARCAAMAYPRFYLDFETINFTIPRWVGTKPFQQIPFQWSCHIERRDGTIAHHGFLDLSGDLPARIFAESLLATVGKRGAIVVYNQTFEAKCIRNLASLLPDLSAPLLRLIDRMVDLLPITRDHYYHPAMMGSWSIKAVVPTVAPELAYGDLDEVADGAAAQLAYAEAIAPQTTASRRAALDAALNRYCANDTLAMVKMVRAFTR